MRFDFADEVAAQWLPDAATTQGTSEIHLLRDVGVALARCAHCAIGAHLATLPSGVVKRSQ